jgi:hypothetical protein
MGGAYYHKDLRGKMVLTSSKPSCLSNANTLRLPWREFS